MNFRTRGVQAVQNIDAPRRIARGKCLKKARGARSLHSAFHLTHEASNVECKGRVAQIQNWRGERLREPVWQMGGSARQ